MTKEERKRREKCKFEYDRISWDFYIDGEDHHDYIMRLHERAGVYTKYAEKMKQEEQDNPSNDSN